MTPEITAVMKPLIRFTADRPLEAAAEFRVGARSVPYLADHGFQDMVVLPGSFYIDMALRMERELRQGVPCLVRNATFHNPVILSAEDTTVGVEVTDRGDGHVEYAFYEAGGEDGGARSSVRQPAAKLQIERPLTSLLSPTDGQTGRGTSTETLSIKEFQTRAQAVIGSERFYDKLRENGNQYGPRFQNVSSIWMADDQILGKLSIPHLHRQAGSHHLHPSLLDSITQLLASFILEKGRTFVLRGIERIKINAVDFSDTLWGHATLSAQDRRDGNGLAGNIRVFGESGRPYLELSGVAFTLLDRVDTAGEKPAASLVIASNFTAEPLEDSLNFWGDHFGVSIRTKFAPFNQVFQELLDAGSAFRRNREGVNIVLLGLEEWASPSLQLSPHRTGRQGEGLAGTMFGKEGTEECFGNRARYVLPNGLQIVHLNQYETDYVYQEIFEDQCYLRHGIRLQDGDTVVDVGANIGLFSLFVMNRCKNPKIYAFEPAPVVYDLLQANCRAHGSNVRAINAGVSDKAKTATFTFYEKSSVFSSFHADEVEDREAIQTVVRNVLNGEAVAGESVDEYVNELTADRLQRRTCECRLTSVSDIIRENQIDQINLLKIDAEKSELDILKGIADADWPKISQIVMEIHDRTGETVKRIEEVLSEKGYHCAVEHEKLLEHSGLFNLYAIRVCLNEHSSTFREEQSREFHPMRPSGTRSPLNGERDGVRGECDGHRSNASVCGMAGLQHTVGEFGAALRSFMNQAAAPLILCVSPRTPAVEADPELRAALNDAEQTLLTEAGTIPNVHFISSASLLQRYPVKNYYDPHSHQAGHIPYSPECYAAMGTALVRAIFNLKRSPLKVIVLDCDNTLWKGICGEDGPLGIEMTQPYRALQEFMVGQMNAGVLLCLCSKNNEKDVLDVFDQRTDMPLKREHLVSCRINWNRKSDNIKSLAKELNLALDSFIFVDDNPVDCADVRVNCPGVLTLQLPGNSEAFPSFLNHVWAFDHTGSTEEDQNRTRLYRENTERQAFRGRSFSLKDFINGLQLRVEIVEATEDQLGRVSQLTFRTNQFNFTTIRRTEKEIKGFLRSEQARCLVVRVVDRFGDYGLVGAVTYLEEADRYKVDSLLLSCRVLGRGVEHAVVSHLGQRAVREGKQLVEIAYLPTEKNLPALEFITSLGDRHRNEGGASWTFSAEGLAGVQYDPDKKTPNGHTAPAARKADTRTHGPVLGFGVVDPSEALQRIGEGLHDIGRIAKAIEAYRLGGEPLAAAAHVAAGNTLQTALLNIWKKVLGRPRIGVNDNFFEAGGTSLRAVQVIATIKRELKQNLSIVMLFESPTVALLAAKLSAASGKTGEGTQTGEAAQRGQRRRYKTMRQHVS